MSDSNFGNVGLLVHADDTIEDMSGNAVDVETVSATLNTSTYKWGTGSMRFNGDWFGERTVRFAPVPGQALVLGTPFAIEFWLRPTASNQFCSLVGVGSPSALFMSDITWLIDLYAGTISLYIMHPTDPGGYFVIFDVSNPPPVNVWTLVQVIYDGTTVRIYQDATEVASGVLGHSTPVDASHRFHIGTVGSWSNGEGPPPPFAGFIDGFRFTNGGDVRPVGDPTVPWPNFGDGGGEDTVVLLWDTFSGTNANIDGRTPDTVGTAVWSHDIPEEATVSVADGHTSTAAFARPDFGYASLTYSDPGVFTPGSHTRTTVKFTITPVVDGAELSYPLFIHGVESWQEVHTWAFYLYRLEDGSIRAELAGYYMGDEEPAVLYLPPIVTPTEFQLLVYSTPDYLVAYFNGAYMEAPVGDIVDTDPAYAYLQLTEVSKVDDLKIERYFGEPDPPVTDVDGLMPILVPEILFVGSIVAARQFRISVFNPSAQSGYLNSFSLEVGDAEEIQITPVTGGAFPRTLAAGGQQEFTVTISPNASLGMHVVYGRIDFDVEGGDETTTTLSLHVSAYGGYVLYCRPNWTEGVIETLEWLTDTIVSFDRTEQRIPVRQWPRRFFEFTAAMVGEDRTFFDLLLKKLPGRLAAFPVWTERIPLGYQPVGATPEIVVPKYFKEFTTVSLFMLSDGSARYQLVSSADVVDDGDYWIVSLLDPVAINFNNGVWIAPVRFGTIAAPTISATNPTADVSSARLTVEVDDSLEWIVESPDPEDIPLMDGTIYDPSVDASRMVQVSGETAVVYCVEPNRVEDVTVDYTRLLDTVDYEVGAPSHDLRQDRTWTVRSFDFTLPDKEWIHHFKLLMCYLLGQSYGSRTAVLFPIGESGVSIVQSVSSGQNYVEIASNGIRESFTYGQVRALFIKTRSAMFALRISSIQPSGPNTDRITFTSTLTGFSVADVVYANLCEEMIPNTDRVQLSYITDVAARVRMTFRSV